jgi:hypothetical protein
MMKLRWMKNINNISIDKSYRMISGRYKRGTRSESDARRSTAPMSHAVPVPSSLSERTCYVQSAHYMGQSALIRDHI